MGRSSIVVFFLVVVEVLVRFALRAREVGLDNKGISFGWFEGVGVWFIGLLLLILFFGIRKLGLGGWMIMAGGLINFVDRIVYGGVWDYIYWPVLGFWNNGGDLMIFVGVIIVLWRPFGKMKISL